MQVNVCLMHLGGLRPIYLNSLFHLSLAENTVRSFCIDIIICHFSQVVNLIPFNPIGSLSQFSTSTNQKVTRFQKILRDLYDIRTTVRKEMGQDISGACGQLVVNLPAKRSVSSAAPLTDIEDLRR